MRRAERAAALALVVVLAAGCGGNETPHLKATALPAAVPVAGVTDLRVQLRNIGGRTLALDGVGRVCGCIATNDLPEALAPGASAMLDLRCRAPRSAAAVKREIVLRTSDPHEPATVLSEPLPGIGPGPAPAAVYLGYVAVGGAATRDVVLPTSVALESLARPADGALAIEPMPTRADGARGVRVRFAPTRPGVVRATLDLGPGLGPLPVVAVGYDGVLAMPSEVRLPTTGDAALPAITLVGVGAAPLAIGRVEYPAGVQGELRTVVPGRQFRLVLRSRGSGALGARTAGTVIRVLGADGATPVLTIPVLAAGDDGHTPAT